MQFKLRLSNDEAISLNLDSLTAQYSAAFIAKHRVSQLVLKTSLWALLSPHFIVEETGRSSFPKVKQLGSHTGWNFLTLQLFHLPRNGGALRFHFLFLKKTALTNCLLLILRTT